MPRLDDRTFDPDRLEGRARAAYEAWSAEGWIDDDFREAVATIADVIANGRRRGFADRAIRDHVLGLAQDFVTKHAEWGYASDRDEFRAIVRGVTDQFLGG